MFYLDSGKSFRRGAQLTGAQASGQIGQEFPVPLGIAGLQWLPMSTEGWVEGVTL